MNIYVIQWQNGYSKPGFWVPQYCGACPRGFLTLKNHQIWQISGREMKKGLLQPIFRWIPGTRSASLNMYNFLSRRGADYVSCEMSHIYSVNVLFFQPEVHREFSNVLKSMEELPINNFNGQSYGYIVYRKKMPIKQGAVLSMRGRPRDLLHVSLK